MTRLLLVRHAQSANNARPEHMREPDPGLTEIGRQQAEHAAKWLAGQSITNLYTSPFRRALETMLPIARLVNSAVQVRADIFEQGGCYRGHVPGEQVGQRGMSRREIETAFPSWQIDDSIGHEGWWYQRPYESQTMAIARASCVAKWLNDTLAVQPGCHAIVTHADFKRLLVAELLGNAWYEPRLGLIPNTSITQFVFRSGAWEMDCFNFTSHLPDDLRTH